jgi:hypothetical protein
VNISIVQDVFNRNFGSEIFYHRDYYKHLIYTEGIMDFQKTLSATWLVDYVITFMPKVIEVSDKEDDGFFVIKLNKKNDIWLFEIFREGYVDGKYSDHITVVKHIYENIDLPTYDYKFFLILSNTNPKTFSLLLPNEY